MRQLVFLYPNINGRSPLSFLKGHHARRPLHRDFNPYFYERTFCEIGILWIHEFAVDESPFESSDQDASPDEDFDDTSSGADSFDDDLDGLF